MKDGTAYASKLKKTYAKLRKASGAQKFPEREDMIHSLGVGVLGAGCGDLKAERALRKLLDAMVDWNEIRISSPREVIRAVGNTITDGQIRGGQLINALQSVFQRENCLSLDRLKGMGRREARQYLEELDGVDEYAVASVLLWGLGGHAIPVDDALLNALRGADLVHQSATRAEVQAFLERHVSASEAKEFCVVMRSFAADDGAARARQRGRRAVAGKARRKNA